MVTRNCPGLAHACSVKGGCELHRAAAAAAAAAPGVDAVCGRRRPDVSLRLLLVQRVDRLSARAYHLEQQLRLANATVFSLAEGHVLKDQRMNWRSDWRGGRGGLRHGCSRPACASGIWSSQRASGRSPRCRPWHANCDGPSSDSPVSRMRKRSLLGCC